MTSCHPPPLLLPPCLSIRPFIRGLLYIHLSIAAISCGSRAARSLQQRSLFLPLEEIANCIVRPLALPPSPPSPPPSLHADLRMTEMYRISHSW